MFNDVTDIVINSIHVNFSLTQIYNYTAYDMAEMNKKSIFSYFYFSYINKRLKKKLSKNSKFDAGRKKDTCL